MAHDVFISYASEDKPIADGVCASLEAKNIRCWIAPRDVLPGQEYGAALVEAINEARLMVLVFSSNSNTSPHVMREVERAASRGIPIVPFRIEDVPPSTSMEYYISSTHWLDALSPPMQKHLKDLADTVAQLADRLKQDASEAEGQVAGALEVTDEESTDQETGVREAEEATSGRSPRRPRGLPMWVTGAADSSRVRARRIVYAAVVGLCIVALVLGLVLTRGGGGEGAASTDATEVPRATVTESIVASTTTSIASSSTTTVAPSTTTTEAPPDAYMTMSDNNRGVKLEVGDRVRVDLATTVAQKFVSIEWMYEALIVQERDSGTSQVSGFITESWLELEALALGRITVRASYQTESGSKRVVWVGYVEVGVEEEVED